VQVHVAKSLGASTLAQSARTRTLTHTYPWPVCYSCAVAAKWSVYEAGLRVPLILRWPRRIPRGVASAAMVTRLTDHTVHTHPLHALLCIKIHEGDEWCTRIPKAVEWWPALHASYLRRHAVYVLVVQVSLIDVLPTIVRAAGGELDAHDLAGGRLDGADLSHLFDGGAGTVHPARPPAHHQYVYAVSTLQNIEMGPRVFPSRMVTDGTLKLIANFNTHACINTTLARLSCTSDAVRTFVAFGASAHADVPPLQLFNLTADPWEGRNLLQSHGDELEKCARVVFAHAHHPKAVEGAAGAGEPCDAWAGSARSACAAPASARRRGLAEGACVELALVLRSWMVAQGDVLLRRAMPILPAPHRPLDRGASAQLLLPEWRTPPQLVDSLRPTDYLNLSRVERANGLGGYETSDSDESLAHSTDNDRSCLRTMSSTAAPLAQSHSAVVSAALTGAHDCDHICAHAGTLASALLARADGRRACSALFVHFPRAGGTSMWHALSSAAARTSLRSPSSLGGNYGCLCHSHEWTAALSASASAAPCTCAKLANPFVHHQLTLWSTENPVAVPPGCQCVSYWTVLREPIGRILSRMFKHTGMGVFGNASAVVHALRQTSLLDSSSALRGMPECARATATQNLLVCQACRAGVSSSQLIHTHTHTHTHTRTHAHTHTQHAHARTHK
jgi:hypothetical protein